MYIPDIQSDSLGDVRSPIDMGSITFDWWPHWTDSKTPEYLKMKTELSLRYGSITFCTTLFIVLFIPVFNYLYNKYFYSNFNKLVSYLRLPALGRNNFIILNLSVIKTIIFWVLVVGFLSFHETHNDWLLIAKRLGRVPTVLLPTVLFLTLRPSPLPKTLYLSLLPIHKWLSRIVVIQGLAHTVIYLCYFQHKQTWFKIYKLANIYGIVAMAGFLIICITSLPIVRRLNYSFFYINHYLFTWIIVICLFFHARPGIPYITLLNVAILTFQVYYRLTRTKKTKLDVIDISPSLSLVLIPNTALSFKTGFPGCHIRINEFYDNKFQDLWNRVCVPLQHPYTLTTLPSDNVQKLIVRNSKFRFQKDKKYYVTGPFLPFVNFLKPRNRSNSKSLLFKIRCKRCLIIVGGSLISFALPIMRVLNYNGCSVKIIWVVRDIEDLKLLNYYSNTIINDDSIEIYITGNYSEETKNSFINSISEYDKNRKKKTLQDQEVILTGTAANNESSALLSTPKNKYDSTLAYDKGKDLELGISKVERSNSESSLSHKSSISEMLFGKTNNDDDLENVDVDLTDCDYDIKPSHSNVTSHEDLTAGIDDMGNYEELDFTYGTPVKSNNNNNNNNHVSQPNDYSSVIKLNLGVDVKFGRPKLGGTYYNWCINQTCIGPVLDISKGESICCKDVPQQLDHIKNNNSNSTQNLLSNYKKSNGQFIGDDDSDALYLNEHFLHNKKKNRGKINDDVWIIGAGPTGLVNNVQLWANDCGFHFHAESFSV